MYAAQSGTLSHVKAQKMKMLAFIIVKVLLDQVVSDDPTTCTTKYGLELDHPGTSCDDIYEKNPASHYKSGLYVTKVQLVYCDMSLECGSHKGGWMRIADLNSSRDNCSSGWIKNSGYNSLCTGGSAAGCYFAHFTTDGTTLFTLFSTNSFYSFVVPLIQ